MDKRFVDIAGAEATKGGAKIVAVENVPDMVSVVVMTPGRDISIDEIETISRGISHTFIELYGDDELPAFEVASPGLDRVLKTPYELGLFVGRHVRVTTKETSEPVIGTLGALDEKGLHVTVLGVDRVFIAQQVTKVSLWDEILGGGYEG